MKPFPREMKIILGDLEKDIDSLQHQGGKLKSIKEAGTVIPQVDLDALSLRLIDLWPSVAEQAFNLRREGSTKRLQRFWHGTVQRRRVAEMMDGVRRSATKKALLKLFHDCGKNIRFSSLVAYQKLVVRSAHHPNHGVVTRLLILVFTQTCCSYSSMIAVDYCVAVSECTLLTRSLLLTRFHCSARDTMAQTMTGMGCLHSKSSRSCSGTLTSRWRTGRLWNCSTRASNVPTMRTYTPKILLPPPPTLSLLTTTTAAAAVAVAKTKTTTTTMTMTQFLLRVLWM